MNALLLLLATAGSCPAQCPTCPTPAGPQAVLPYGAGVPQGFDLYDGRGFQFHYGNGYVPQGYAAAPSYGFPQGSPYAAPAVYAGAAGGGCSGAQAMGGYAPQGYAAVPSYSVAPPAVGSYAPSIPLAAPPAVGCSYPPSSTVTIPYGVVPPAYPYHGRNRYVVRQRY